MRTRGGGGGGVGGAAWLARSGAKSLATAADSSKRGNPQVFQRAVVSSRARGQGLERTDGRPPELFPGRERCGTRGHDPSAC